MSSVALFAFFILVSLFSLFLVVRLYRTATPAQRGQIVVSGIVALVLALGMGAFIFFR